MSRRAVKHRPLRKIPLGDMREPIVLFRRSIRPSMSKTTHEVRHLKDTVLVNAWANITTYNGILQFDKVNIGQTPTHKIVTRYNSEMIVDDDIMIKDSYNNNYKILEVENLENRNEYISITARKLGPEEKLANT